MSSQITKINKKDNKLLYLIDASLDRFVMLVIVMVRLIVPGKYKTKFDKLVEHKDMLHNVVGLAFFNALGGLCVMATQVKLANYLGASVYGVYSYCLAIGEVGALFVRYGRNKTMVRDLIQFPEKRNSMIVSTSFLSLINLGLFLAVAFVCHKPLDIEVNWTYFLLILSPCIAQISLGPVYESLKLMSWSSIYALLQKFGFLAVIWPLFFFHFDVGLFEIGIIVVIVGIVVVAMEYYEIGTQLHINFLSKVRLIGIWNLYKSNFVIFLSCVTGVAFGPLIRLILNSYTDSKTVGIYAAGLQIYHICLFLNTQISRVGNPMMAEAGKADCSLIKRRRLVSRYTIVMLVTSLPFALPMLLFPRTLTSLLFTKEYALLANYLPFLSIYLIAISIGVVYTQFMISMRMDKTYFVIYILSAVSTLIMALLIIPILGILGAFISLCIPHSIGCLLYMLFSMKVLKK